MGKIKTVTPEVKFKYHFKKHRHKAGLSQDALAEISGVSQVLICQWESGKTNNVSLHRLMKIADALGVEPEDLFTVVA